MHHRNPSGLGAPICAYIAGAIAPAVANAESLAAFGIDKSLRHFADWRRRAPKSWRRNPQTDLSNGASLVSTADDARDSRAVREVERREVEGDGYNHRGSEFGHLDEACRR